MRQTSLTTWLRKPATISAPPPDALLPLVPQPAPTIPLETISIPPTGTNEVPAVPHDAHDPSTLAWPTALAADVRRRLPPQATLVPLTRPLLPQFKRLNTLLLPIAYSARTYEETVADPLISRLSFAVLWHDGPASVAAKPRMVAAIRCKLLPAGPPPTAPSTAPQDLVLYISTIGVLAPYRAHGLATHLLTTALAAAAVLPPAVIDASLIGGGGGGGAGGTPRYRVASIRAHVWEANADGRAWYEKRGFAVAGREEGYYQRLKPRGAVVMRRGVAAVDLVRGLG